MAAITQIGIWGVYGDATTIGGRFDDLARSCDR
jgi:hypothetical protein